MNLKINFKYILITVSALILLGLLVGAFIFWQRIYLPKEPGSVQEIFFSVKKGDAAKQIATNLENNGIIKYGYGPVFRAYVLLSGVSKNLQSGDYLLSPGMNIQEIASKIATGDAIKRKITILEGWDLRDIAGYLESENIVPKGDFFKVAGWPLMDYSKMKPTGPDGLALPEDFSKEFDFLKDKPKNLCLEGYIFPDTYEFSSEDNAEDILQKVLANFDKKLTPEIRNEIARQKKTIFEIVTMASIIEKEVNIADDKEIVAGILWKRLEIGMPLQVDASVAYITGSKKNRTTYQDLEINSPYNTYQNRGLPPGPISNPGMDSILAALYPKNSDYLYYLSAPGGKTIFSRTLEEHNIAKQKYLK